MSVEQQVIIGTDTSRPLLGMLYQPVAPALAQLVICAPAFEERKSSHRPLVELARALADAGVIVLRFDYCGCGDSAGDLTNCAPSEWLHDIHHAYGYLAKRSPELPIGLLGLRLGGALALEVAAHNGNLSFLIMWQPVLNGRDYLQEELRKTLMKQMLTFGGTKLTRDEVINKLEGGYSVDFDGYCLTPRMYQELCGINLPLAAKTLNLPVLIEELTASGQPSGALTELQEVIEKHNADVSRSTLKHQPFWNLLGYVDCSPAADCTIDWLAQRGWADRQAQPIDNTVQNDAQLSGLPPDQLAEQPVNFSVDKAEVRGILHSANISDAPKKIGVVFCHGWSGSRLGPHRMFVKTARALAGEGIPSLRLDFRGRGDSNGATLEASIRSMAEDTEQAVRFFSQTAGVEAIYLLGICSGGKVAISAATACQQVDGLMIWSGEAMGDLRKTGTNRQKSLHMLRTYARKLISPATWRKIIRREVNVKGVNKALFNQETRSEAEAHQESGVLRKFRSFQGPVLFVYGSNDPDTKLAGESYRHFCDKHKIDSEFHEIEGANHSFYSLDWEKKVIDLTLAWLRRQAESCPPNL